MLNTNRVVVFLKILTFIRCKNRICRKNWKEYRFMKNEIKFDKKYLIALVLPLIVEQILAVSVGMADMIMAIMKNEI